MSTGYVSPIGNDTSGTLGTIGDPWKSVAYALSRMGGGSEVIMLDGTYGPQYIDSVSYGGTFHQPTIVRAANLWGAKVTTDGSVRHNLWTPANHVHFYGIKTHNAYPTAELGYITGVKIEGDGGALFNMWVCDNQGGGISYHQHNFLRVEGCVIERNGFDNHSHGAYCSGKYHIWRGNIVRWNVGFGLHLYDANPTSPGLQWSIVEHNICYGNGGDQLMVQCITGKRNLIQNNTCVRIIATDGNPICLFGPWDGSMTQLIRNNVMVGSIPGSTISGLATRSLPIPAALAEYNLWDNVSEGGDKQTTSGLLPGTLGDGNVTDTPILNADFTLSSSSPGYRSAYEGKRMGARPFRFYGSHTPVWV